MSDVAKRIEGLSPAKRRALRQRLVKQKGAAPKAAIPRQPRGRGPLPLSFGQERLWFIAELEPESGVYNTFYALRFRGELAVPALAASFLDVVGRHESLRTTFAAPDGQPIQVVHAAPPAFPLPVVALERLPAADREAAVKHLVAAAADPVFDLARGPLLRPVLMRLAPREHILLVVIHHIVSDGWSLGVLVREVAALYQARITGRPSPLPELPIQYADFALWQRQWLVGEVLDEEVAYWRRKLAGAPPRLELPCDRPRALRRSYRGTTLGLRLEPELTAALRALSSEQGSTLFVTLLTGFAILLGRYSGQSDVVVGSPVANRQRTELEGLIGFLLNTLILRLDLSGAPAGRDPDFLELLGRAREVALQAFAHQDLPFAKLVEELQPERQLGQIPFYQVMFVLQNAPRSTLRLPGLVIEALDNEDQPEDVDFTFFLVPDEKQERLIGRLRYSVELYDATTIRRLLRHFRTLMEGIAADPRQRLSALSCLSSGERQQLVAEWNAAADFSSPALIHAEFETQAAHTPDAVAVCCREQRLSYGELNERSGRLAHFLRASGVGPEVRVGLCVERSSELVVAILGILKAGGAYVPLDPSYPPERVAFMVADAGCPVLLTQESLLEGLPEHAAQVVCVDREWPNIARYPETPLGAAAHPENPAYVIYTSGSTGRPKGVVVEHRNITRLFASTDPWFRFGPRDVWTLFHSSAFDFSVWELWGALLYGGRLVVVPWLVSRSPEEFYDLVCCESVTVLNQTPSAFQHFMVAGTAPPTLRCVVFGGEALTPRRLRSWQGGALINMYGITETTVHVTYHPLTPADLETSGSPIGRGLPDLRLLVLDADLAPAPLGAPGQIYVGGAGVARGYLGRPGLTAERFVPDPFSPLPGARTYRTGDLGRWLAGGTLDFLGRTDHQVQLRGFRVELGEIEAVLSQHPAVRTAVVVAREERLVAYPVADGDPPAVETLRQFVGEQLPDYMVPSRFAFLDDLPLTPSGKVDRRALPEPEALRPELETAYMPPTTELEMGLAAIWQEVLDLEQVGLDDNFFDVGGHSLLLAQVRVKVSELVGRDVPLMELFRHPDIRSLAALLSGEEPIREHPAPAVVGRAQPGAEIAIIGISARFAGASSVEEFWHNLCGGVESIRRLSVEELEAAGVDPEIYRAPDYVPACADVRDPDRFDAALFGFNPREAEILDPQHRVLLECAWQALESAGYDPIRYPERIGVFAGAGMSRYAMNVFTNPELVQSLGMAPLMFAVGQDFLAPRISYKLNLTGPSMVVQTACSTSLVAVHLARQALAEGGCEMALAGGVTLLEHPPQGYRYLEGGIQSSDGHCRAFDAAGQGMVSSSGAGMVVLKRLDEALADGDHIHAVVKATAVNNDGSVKVGFTAPSEEGQAKVIRNALQAAGAAAESIGYVEGHGTATPLGDPIEVAALTRVFREGTARQGFCALGSVKTNVGHADAAAGAASLIKAALAVEHALVPPSLHFQQPNPAIDLADTPFYVPTELRPWDGGEQPRRAGVSAFGIGGTNFHAILEQPPAIEPSGPSREWQLLVLSANTPTALDAVTARLADDLEADSRKSLADVAFTCQVGRRRLPYRRTLVCRGREEAIAALARPAEQAVDGCEERNRRGVIFLFSGLGDHYPGMGRGLYEAEPVFRAEVDRCCELLEPLLGLDLRQLLYPPEAAGEKPQEASGPDLRRLLGRAPQPAGEAHQRLGETRLAQPAVFVIEVALARLLESWGIVPRAMIGYSLGEYTAAHVAGVLSLEEALTLVAERAELISTLSAGAMVAVTLPEEEVLPLLGDQLSLAAANAPEVSVVAGPEEAVARLEEQLTEQGLLFQRLQTRHAFHSSMMEPIATAFGERVRRRVLRPPEIPYLSNVTGTWITAAEATDPEYWVRHLCQPVRFTEGLGELFRDPEPVLLEIGPGQALATAARQHPARPAGRMVLASLGDERERHGDQAFLLRTLGQLWLAGFNVDWNGFYAGERRRRVALPTYPFERQRYWIEPGAAPLAARIEPRALEKREDLTDWFYAPAWNPSALAGEAEGQGRWLLFVDDCGLGAEMVRQLTAAGASAVTVRPGEAFARLDPGRYEVRAGERSDYEELYTDLAREGGIPPRCVHLWSVTADPVRTPEQAPEEALELGFYSLLGQMQGLGGVGFSEPLQLALVSNGVHQVTGDEPLWPEKAALLGPSKVIPKEYPNVRCAHIDVTLDPDSREPLARRLIAELGQGLADQVVAYREGTRWAQSWEPAPLADVVSGELPWRREGVYLITGGLGGLGLVFARHLAESWRAKLVLTGRSPFPAPDAWDAWLASHDEDDRTSGRIRALRALEELGAEVVARQADVADEQAMRRLVAEARERFGPFDGVIHAAGIPTGGLIQVKQRPEVEAVLRPKVEGTRVLAAVLDEPPADLLLLISSMAVVVSPFGQVDYCAANHVLDGFARQFRARWPEVRTVTVDWGPWEEVGMGAEGERQLETGPAVLARGGMSPAQGVEALERILSRHPGVQIVASAIDLTALLAEEERARGDRDGLEQARPETRPRHQRPGLSTPYAAPRTAQEERLAELWQELLGIDRVGIHDDFIELGGHSLLGIQLYSRLQKAFGVTVPLPVLFETQTIAAMAAVITGGDRLQPLEAAVVPVSRDQPLPLSFAQERLWFLGQLEPESAAYNIPQAFRLRGPVSVPALERSLEEIVRRHEVLRTTFEQRAQDPFQVIAPPAPLMLTTVDLSAAGGEHEAMRLLWREGGRPFDLARDWPIRACLMRLAPLEHRLLVTVHHIVFDTWSQVVLRRDLAELYTALTSARAPRLPALEVQYADFAAWQRERLRDQALDQQIAYWTGQLGSQPPVPELPTDRPRPPVDSFAGDHLQVGLEPALAARLEALSRERGVTLYMTMLAIFQTLLHRYTGQLDLTTGTPVGGRTRPEVKNLIGMFINNLVLRTDFSGDPPFTQLLERVRKVSLEAFAHQDLPFEKLVEVLRPQRDLSRTPLYQVVFALQTLPAPAELPEPPGVELTPLEVNPRSSIYDLTLALDEALSGWLEYNTDLYDTSTVCRLVEHFRCLARAVVAEPATRLSELPLLTPGERHQLLEEWKVAGDFPSPATIHAWFEGQAALTPEAVAVCCREERASYGELNARSNRLAHFLRASGVAPEVRVGLCLERSSDLVVAILGILKAGGAYVPLDPSYPRERVAFMVADAGCPVLVTQESLLEGLPEHAAQVVCVDREWPAIARHPATNPRATVHPENPAYVIYTSGSTGQPKGVVVEHRNVTRLFASTDSWFRFGPEDVWTLFHSSAFDFSVWELWGALGYGGRLVVVPWLVSRSPDEFHDLVCRESVTVLNQTPSAFDNFMIAGAAPPALRYVVFGGEALTPRRLRPWRGGALVNMYGITETTVHVTHHPLTAADLETSGSPIGRAIPDLRLQVLDPRLEPTPAGVPGQLFVGGAGVSRGYLGRPGLTAERFVPDPYSPEPGARSYRTGDLARWLAGGTLDFLGRTDHQVQLRGFRVELGEIEAVLSQHSAVQTAVVVAREERLVAYLVAAGEKPAVETLRRFVGEQLPEYMVPSRFVFLDSLPQTPSGKVDRRALPEPEAARPELATEYAAPTSDLEQSLAAIWQEVLGLEQVGLYDNFFDVGGHSLLLAQVRVRLREQLDRDVPLVDLFRFPSIRTLADHLSGARDDRAPAVVPAPAVRPGEDLAIVGMSCRLPGAESVDEFWSNLCAGLESIRMLSDEELIAAGVDRTVWSAPEYIRATADIKDPDHFDAALFGFSPREAEALDPQHRIFLECAWQALEAAGYDPTRHPGRIGVYAGAGMGRYALNIFGNPELMQTLGGLALTLAVGQDFLATRTSYKLNLTGPSVVVQTACSTALTAVHMARQALLEGECDMALAGGVTVAHFKPQGYIFTEGGIASSDGHCRAFDAGAGGTVFSSGAGVLVLKRLSEAQADGDVVHAVIKGSAVNNDGGLKVGYTAPSEDGQAEVIRAALRTARVEPETISYVETHGTATPLGDPIEVAALTQVFREATERIGFCGLGSVKTNIGHTDTAAGAAGLIKTTLALKHGLLPPSLHFETPNPEIDFDSGPFRVVTELRPWESAEQVPRRAGVSAFGIGGTNAHVILEEAPPAAPSGPSRRWQLLVVSAATSTARTAISENLAGHLRAAREPQLADVAFTCQVGRRRLPHRRFLVCRDAAEAAELLARGADSERVYDASEERAERSVVFLLSGLGDHYAGMGRELYDEEPTFRAEVDRCCEFLEPILGVDLRTVLYPSQEEPAPENETPGVDLRALLGRGARPAAPQPLDETRLAHPAVFVVQVALARLLGEWGVRPAALIGYSLGEYTAAHLAGVLSLEDALSLVAARAQLIATVPAGGMLAVPLPAAAVTPLLGEELSLAATNGPEVSVVAGSEEAIDRFAEQLTAGGQVCQRLRTRHAFHSHMLRPIAAEFGARVREVALRPPQVRYLSNVTGTWIRPREATDPDYWVRHLCETVRFAEGLQELMADAEPVLLEIGPGQALATSARQHPARPAGKLVLATLRDERERQSDQAFLLHTLGRIWLTGVEVDWHGFASHEKRRRVVLPGYPFERQRFFVEAGEKLVVGPISARNADVGDWFYLPSWKRSLPPAGADAAGRWLLLADDEGLAEQVAQRLGAGGGEVTLVHAASELRRRGEREWEIDPERPEHYQQLLETVVAEGGAPEQIVHFRSFTPAGDEAPFPRRFAAAQGRGLYSLLWLTQALVKVVFADRVTLTVVTAGMQDVEGGDVPAPEKATLLGALRVIPQEYGHIRCRNVDVAPAGGGHEELAALLSDELTAAAPEPVVAWRSGSRWIESFEPVHLEPSPEGGGLRSQGVYLITGGLGQIGLALAEYLAREVGARLVLVSRSPLPPRSAWEETLARPAVPPEVEERITRLRALQEAGTELLVVAADAADRAQMQAAVDQARECFGGLDGVFHLAGVFHAEDLVTVDVTDVEACRQQFRPKVDALEVLAAVLEPLPLDFCVLFSSLSVVLGGLGFTAYSAASAFMDAFARARRRRGGRWISVNWDAWKTDLTEDQDSGFGRTLAQFEMHPEEALEALRRVLALRGVPQIVVSTGDLEARIATWVRAPGDQAPTPGLSARQRPELSQAYVAPASEIEEEIAEIWQTLLGIEQVGTHDNFLELGGDSLIGVQLIARLRESFRVQISVPEVFEAPTVAGLATLIAGRDEQEDLSELDMLLDEVAEMSPEEVEEEIRRHQMPASSDS